MADVSLKYKGNIIGTLSASGSVTAKTLGKYMEGDLLVEYESPAKPAQTKSVNPTESQQTVTPDSGKVLSSVTVGAISSTYVGSGVTRKAAATYTPTTTDQTIVADQYLTGAQTVKGDANLVAGNIKQGVTIFNIQGEYSGGVTPTGTLSISANGTYDVTNYASAAVSVPAPTANFKQLTATVSAVKTADFILVNSADALAHYQDSSFQIQIQAPNSVLSTSGTFALGVFSNQLIFDTSYGLMVYRGSTTFSLIHSDYVQPSDSTGTKNGQIYVASNGDIHIIAGTNRVRAGTYLVTMTW